MISQRLIRVLPVVLVLAVGACRSNAVHGRVDGFKISIRSSFLVYEPPAGDGDGVALVMMSDLPSACAVYRYWFSELQKADTPKAMAEAWAVAFPEQFWELLISVRTEGGTWPASGTKWQGLGWEESPEPGRISGALVQHNAHRPAEWFDGLEGYENYYYTNAGFVSWRSADPGQKLSGVFQTATVDEEGIDSGPVEIEFNATPCPNLVGADAVLPTPVGGTQGDTGQR